MAIRSRSRGMSAVLFLCLLSLTFLVSASGFSSEEPERSEDSFSEGPFHLAHPEKVWMKIRARDKFERTRISNTGVAIELVREDFVIALGSGDQLVEIENTGWLEKASLTPFENFDFPDEDSDFHNYDELAEALKNLAQENPEIAHLDSIGNSLEGRPLWRLRLTHDRGVADQKPGILFLGGHHAREHLSVEIPLRLARHLIDSYRAGDARIVQLIQTRDIHIVPIVNPDGSEHDIEDGRYRMWRKNRSVNHDGSRGVDLNRNYSYKWGQGGASSRPSSDTYRGPGPFSEPETQAIRSLIENQVNISTLLSFHTFSELVLYPWGYTYNPIADEKDFMVFKTMAKKIASWNGYTPQQSSDLYITSGDTTDWAYGEHKVFAFTFELDPANSWDGGFYPGQSLIPIVFKKNLEPCLYLIEYADNPYRVLTPSFTEYGLHSPLLN